jgi:hypothetical protein
MITRRRSNLFLHSQALCLLLCLLSGTLPASRVTAQVAPVPSLMNFQGRLAKPDGTPVADGTYSIRFSLWDAVAGGTEKWNQTLNTVTVRNGTFAVLLSGFPAGTFHTNLFLEIKIGNNAPLTPRQPLVSVAYAMKAGSVQDGAITGASIANGTITAEKLAANSFDPLVWLLGGNSGTNPASHFLGTKDNQPLVFRTNNMEKLRLLSTTNAALRFVSNDRVSHIELDNLTGELRLNSNGQGEPATLRLDLSGSAAVRNNLSVGGAVSANSLTVNSLNLETLMAQSSNSQGTRTILNNTSPGGRSWSMISTGNAHVLGAGHLMFMDSSTIIPYLTIKANGNVGVGSNNPTADLQVGNGQNFANITTLGVAQGSGDTVGLSIRNSTGNPVIQMIANNSGANYIETDRASNLLLGTNGVGGDVTMRVSPFKTVGIPFAVDNARLSVYAQGLEMAAFFEGNCVASLFLLNSDARFKQEVTPLTDALSAILSLRGVSYAWRQDIPGHDFSKGRQIGFIAQEVEKVLPELVHTASDGYKSVAYQNVVPVLVEAVKAQQKQREADRSQINTLRRDSDSNQKQIEGLKAENAELRAKLEALAEAVAELKASRERR